MDQFLTGGHSLVSANESIGEGEVALPLVSDFILQAQKSLNFEPSGVQKTMELDASQLERHSALYNLEHSSDLLIEHIFSHSPPPILQLDERKKTEIDRQPLANLFKKKSRHRSTKSKRNNSNPSKMLKKFGLERLTIFQPRSGRDGSDLTSPTIAPQNDPRSPNLSTLDRVFLTFSSIKPSEAPSSVKGQSSKPEVPSGGSNTQIGLGLPSRVSFRRKLRQQEMMSQEIDAARCRSRRSTSDSSSQECPPNYSFIVTEPSFGSSYNRVQNVVVESSNQFLKPSQFTERSLYDIVEVPTPPSSILSSSPSGTPSSSRNQWSSPFIRLNPPQKRKSFRTQSSTTTTTSTGSPTNDESVEVVAAINLNPLLSAAEVLKAPPAVTTPRPGFKRYVSKFRDLFKRSSRSLKTSNSVLRSPGLIEHPDTEPSRQDGVSCGARENSLTSSISAHNLQLLF